MSDKHSEAFIVPGFRASGVSAGIKAGGALDLALIFSEVPAAAAGVFTTNCFKAAPVLLDMERIASGAAQAILANSGNANAATGPQGQRNARAMAKAMADRLKIDEKLVLVASTGVIGHQLPIEKIVAAADKLAAGLRAEGISEAEEAIMTTDRFPKMSLRKGRIGGREITLAGIAKGAGMIEPAMATLLCFVMTDAAIEGNVLNGCLRKAVEGTLNSITVDGCMSTNDTVLVLANGLAGNRTIRKGSGSLVLFREMLAGVLSDLGRAMVRDGEGATKIVEIVVSEARSTAEAKKVAYAIANSNLVKAAFFGRDPNWGRIISAAGSLGIPLPVQDVELFFEGVPLFRHGQGVKGREKELRKIMARDEIQVQLRLKRGERSWRILASDLTHEYVTINAHYHT
ncbi:MAG: bifunctional glutamate N-acetyltransferase/amino-acid acetyltransferase ArgJ [Deltaproteobacteria bacterium]|nr:bifunctional glutamate N-acetyltransferase/amino-acid acetyltransferase ArgJ [Deltaproteobacteria bacterium]